MSKTRRSQADLARLRGLLLELGRLAEGAGALAAHLNDSLVVSCHSNDFAEAQEAKQVLTAVGALCANLRRTAADAHEWAAGIDAELPGLLATGAHSAEGEHPFRSKPNTGSSQAEHHRSEAMKRAGYCGGSEIPGGADAPRNDIPERAA